MDKKKRPQTPEQEQQMTQAPTIPVPQPTMPVMPPVASHRPTEGAENMGVTEPNATLSTGIPMPVGYPLERKMTRERISDAIQTLTAYKSGKANLEKRVIACEEWWRLRNWSEIKQGNPFERKPTSAWLFNTIITKISDAMEAYPEANILAREQGDEQEARILKSILPVVLQQNDFKETYHDVISAKYKGGTGIYGVFWNGKKHGSLGDVEIRQVSILNIFWEPGIRDIQQSENLFCVELVNNSVLEQTYPQMRGKSGGKALAVEKFFTEDNIDTSKKSLVVDWYYHTYSSGKPTLHLCKFCGDTVLYCSEDEPETAERGLYDHGMYPFEADIMFGMEGSPAAFGYIDICKSAQEYIDLLDAAMMRNAIMGATPRFLLRDGTNINEEEYLDWTKPGVHVAGNLDDTAVRQLQMNPMDAMYLNMLQHKIEEMKETAGNRDVSNGGVTSGVTAASAIAAMQEQSGKLSKDAIRGSYRAFERVVKLVIELIRQFYTTQRTFRITGEMGQQQYVSYSNAGLQPQPMDPIFGIGGGYRVPEFDIEVSAQNATEYTKISQNELAINFYNLGFFDPQRADQALATLDMMDFSGKDEAMQKISRNQTMQQMLIQWQQMALTLASKYEPALAEGLAQSVMGGAANPSPVSPAQGAAGKIDLERSDETGIKKREHGIVENARERSQSAYMPEA